MSFQSIVIGSTCALNTEDGKFCLFDQELPMNEGTKLYLLAPIIRGRKGEYRKEFAELQKKGFTRVRVDHELDAIEAAPAGRLPVVPGKRESRAAAARVPSSGQNLWLPLQRIGSESCRGAAQRKRKALSFASCHCGSLRV